MELEEYRKLTTYLAESEQDFIFENDSVAKASIVTEGILRHSNYEVRIFDKHLNGDITEDFPNILDAFVNVGDKTLKVIIEGDFSKDKKIYKILKKLSADNPDRVKVKKGTKLYEELVKGIFKDGSLAYFTLGDSKSYRLEMVKSPNSNEISKEAECNFNDKDGSVVSKLIKVFDLGFENDDYSKPIEFE
jgi:hypothetical protein